MSLPKQVQAHQAELDAYEAQLQAAQEDTSADDAQEAGQEEHAEAPQAAQAPVAPTPEPKAVQPPAKWDDEEEKWEHKYRRLQGKYDAEVPRLHNEVKELKQVIGSLQTKLEAPPPKAEEPSSLVTKDDVDAFGEDLIDLQRRVAKETAREFQAELKKLQAENATLREQITQTGSQIGEVSFNTRLHQLVPDFSAVNQDASWIAWLNEYDPMVRGPRRVVAQAAFARGDAEAVKAYVDLWRGANTQQAPDRRQKELQRQVQPARAHGQATQERGGQKIYSDVEARSAFDRIQKLVIQGRYDEAAKLETEISAAYTEGRVQM